MSKITLRELIEHGTSRPRKDGSTTRQIYTTTTTGSSLGRVGKLLDRCGNTLPALRRWHEAALRIIQEEKESKLLDTSQCRDCMHIGRHSPIGRIIFVVPAKIYRYFDDDEHTYVSERRPVPGMSPFGTLCEKDLIDSDRGPTRVIPLIPATRDCPTYKKRQD